MTYEYERLSFLNKDYLQDLNVLAREGWRAVHFDTQRYPRQRDLGQDVVVTIIIERPQG